MEGKLPWEDLTSPVYPAINTRKRKPWVIMYGWFCVCVLAFCAVTTKYHIVCALLAVFLAFAIVLKKTEVITERGYESFTDLKLFTSDELWTWDEIDNLTYENNPAVPDTTLLFLTKGPRTRKVFMKNADADKVKALAKAKKITVYDGNEYRAEARAYNASQKRPKKKKKKK